MWILACIILPSDVFVLLARLVLQDTDENKLVYTDIFRQYTEMLESGIESRIKQRIPGMDMGTLLALIDAHSSELEGWEVSGEGV